MTRPPSNVISLSVERKKRARADKAAEAAENRVKHGRTKAEKARDKDAKKRREAELKGAELDDGET